MWTGGVNEAEVDRHKRRHFREGKVGGEGEGLTIYEGRLMREVDDGRCGRWLG